MAVELTPSGTRGVKVPKLPRPLMKIVFTIVNLVLRLRGAKLLELTTTGARSGLPRTVSLSWFPDGEQAWLIVASFAGAAKHPDWYVNLAKNPDQVWITVGGRKIHVRPESLKGTERQDAWDRIVAKAPAYAGYETKTDREIPVVRLRPS